MGFRGRCLSTSSRPMRPPISNHWKEGAVIYKKEKVVKLHHPYQPVFEGLFLVTSPTP
jgi:hypothetical protein